MALQTEKRKDLCAVVRGLLIESSQPDKAKLPPERLLRASNPYIAARLCPINLSKLPQHPPVVIAPDHVVIIGGGGIVIRCQHQEVPNVRLALKVMRPSLFGTDTKRFHAEVQKAKNEYWKGLSLSHQNIVKTLAASVLSVPTEDSELPMRVMLAEWVEGATVLKDYLLPRAGAVKIIKHTAILRLLMDLMSGLHHLHENGLVHWDMKSDNILVSNVGQIKITDLGNARYISSKEGSINNDKSAQTSLWNLPEGMAKKVNTEISGFSVNRVDISTDGGRFDCRWLDLWMVAKELNRYFLADSTEIERDRKCQADCAARGVKNEFLDIESSKSFIERTFPSADENAQQTLNIIRLIIRRLLKPTTPDNDRYYDSADEVITDLEKVQPEFGDAQEVEELHAVPRHNLRVPETATKNDVFNRRFRAIVDTRPVQRLKSHKQLATIADVYPGARHTRFEHSVGVFFTVLDFVRALYADRRSIFWRISAEERDVEALLIAALFHDVGHYSFSHYVEDLKGIFRGYKHENYVVALLDPRRAAPLAEEYAKVAASEHSEVLAALISGWNITEEDADDLCRRAANVIVVADDMVGSTSDPWLTRAGNRFAISSILHSAMDGFVDADKLDYLVRDGHHAGVMYCRGVDDRRFFQSLTTIVTSEEVSPRGRNYAKFGAPTVCVTSKGLLPVLSILMARFFMFSCMYWHKTVRAETAMVQHVIASVIAIQKDRDSAKIALSEYVTFALTHRDDESLRYLREVAEKARCDPRVLRMCDGLLGRREYLPVAAYEVLYDESSKPKEIFEAIDAKLQQIQDDEVPLKGARGLMKFKRLIAGEVSRHLSGKRGIKMDEHDVLVDMPPQGKDQVKNAYVFVGAEAVPIQALNPIGKSIDESFKLWVRTLRVFVSREILGACEGDGFSKDDLRDACRKSLASIADLVDPQGRLPL